MKNKIRDDYELIYLINQNDEQALAEMIVKYKKVLLMYANQYRYVLKKEYDEDEMLQICYIALYTAIRTYNEQLGNKFTTYLRVIVTRELQIHVRSLHSVCRKANLEAISLHRSINDESERYYIDLVESRNSDFDTKEYYYHKEFLMKIKEVISEFKKEDQIIFDLWRIGLSYNEIALHLKCPVKKVDNSIQRMKKKLRSVIDYNNAL